MALVSSSTLRKTPRRRLDHVQPGGAGWGEVEMKPWVALLPSLDPLMFVGGVVVTNQVNFLARGRLFSNQVQKPNPFLMTVLAHAGSNDTTIGGVQRSE